ncbi:hypothetical protein B6N60_01327 [Richelia sinica FACHB-800]|uniref:Uncharacterized protein n=1 Tax=Richelia sinica FACHB-800 TaxID=1357546 RepID=A0A975T5R6_9NOST|nr:hypothetical protein [Richelia sinica]MBD2663780.1 hypothetical protein [Richelia sinica FACHB-800]QXE22642.1 hypothetical protein B6N60_01327 [Richelia sinica FACHB-800]
MKVYQKLNFKLKDVSDIEFIDIMRHFTQQVKDWTYLEKESETYAKDVGETSCKLLLEDNHYNPAFAITKKKDKFYYIDRIDLSYKDDIPILEYNILSRRFYHDFKSFIHSNSYSISIEISKEDIGLKEIISSQRARESFEKYLNRFNDFPFKYHHKDIKRLDLFICAASRFCRNSIDVDYLKRYLMEDRNWKTEDAKWCCDRIVIGLDILKVNKNLS